MNNYKLLGDFLQHSGRLPNSKKELAKFILFGGWQDMQATITVKGLNYTYKTDYETHNKITQLAKDYLNEECGGNERLKQILKEPITIAFLKLYKAKTKQINYKNEDFKQLVKLCYKKILTLFNEIIKEDKK